MSQAIAISRQNFAGLGKKAAKKQPKESRLTFSFLFVVLICALGVFYIFEVNNVATQGYQIQSLEKKVQDLKDTNEKLKIREAELRSMYNIEEKTKELNMSAPANVSYMQLPGNVAMK